MGDFKNELVKDLEANNSYSDHIFGVRHWNISDGKLTSLVLSDHIWETSLEVAGCMGLDNHAPPQEECHCGLYAYYSLGYEVKSVNPYPVFEHDVATGIVAASGKTFLYNHGFRAERMQIIAFLDNGTKEIRGVSKNYGVPLISGTEEFRRYPLDKGGLYIEDFDKPLYINEPTVLNTDSAGLLHSKNGLPARIYNGAQEWWRHGELHRESDRPAIIHDNGNQEWWTNGRLHRDGDLPAVIRNEGDEKTWYKEGQQHRESGPAYIWRSANVIEYWQQDRIHRDGDLPAIIVNDNEYLVWMREGKHHRENGPALISNGQDISVEQWWIDGKRIDKPS